ncbi:hypothetical protein EV360DRAFT_25529, partial [Lentinula raphanica]
ILWEICELSFRQDLVALDKYMDKSSLSLIERNALIDECWQGPRNVAVINNSRGFSTPDIQKRIPYICALHRLMSTWKGERPEVLYHPFPTDYGAHNYPIILENIEFSLAQFYVESFLQVFYRLPSIP